VVGTLAAYADGASPALVRAVGEVARWVEGQLELAELDTSRAELAEAQVRALRAQISPHFVNNALTAIASFIRTDPPRARELLLEFADFVRYSSRTHGEFTTLAEELRSVDRYLLLERARFGERLQVVLRVAPEVLPVAVPYLCLQPLVENAVQHGLEGGRGTCTIRLAAEDDGEDCRITVEDDGAGADPDRIRAALAGTGESMGLGNVDSRLRASYGDEYGLVVETAVGAGTRVSLRIPKFVPGVRAS
jgi:two-component system LytT family sensor kinase